MSPASSYHFSFGGPLGSARPFVGRGFPDAPCTVPVRGARRPGAPSPCVGAASGRPGRTRSHLAGAGVPPGGKTVSFSTEKETVLHSSSAQSPHHSVSALRRKLRSAPLRLLSPQKLRFCGAPGAGLRLVGGGKRRLAALRTVWGPAPAVTAITGRNRDRLWFDPPAACGCRSQGRVRQCHAWGATTSARPVRRGSLWL